MNSQQNNPKCPRCEAMLRIASDHTDSWYRCLSCGYRRSVNPPQTPDVAALIEQVLPVTPRWSSIRYGIFFERRETQWWVGCNRPELEAEGATLEEALTKLAAQVQQAKP